MLSWTLKWKGNPSTCGSDYSAQNISTITLLVYPEVYQRARYDAEVTSVRCPATIPCWVELSNGELSRGNNPKVTFWPFCTIATIPLVVYYEYEATTQKWYPTIFLFCKRFPNGLHLVYHDTTKNYSTSLQWRGKGDIQPFFLKFLLRHYIRTSTSTPHSV